MCRPCRARRPPRSRCCRVSLGWCRSAGNPCHRCHRNHRNHRRIRHTRHLHRPRLPLPPGGRPRRREPCRCRCRASCTAVAALARTRHGCPRPPGRSSWPPGAFGCGYSEPSFLLSVGIRVQSMSHYVQMVHELSMHAAKITSHTVPVPRFHLGKQLSIWKHFPPPAAYAAGCWWWCTAAGSLCPGTRWLWQPRRPGWLRGSRRG